MRMIETVSVKLVVYSEGISRVSSPESKSNEMKAEEEALDVRSYFVTDDELETKKSPKMGDDT